MWLLLGWVPRTHIEDQPPTQSEGLGGPELSEGLQVSGSCVFRVTSGSADAPGLIGIRLYRQYEDIEGASLMAHQVRIYL